jgi:hypothetical protein
VLSDLVDLGVPAPEKVVRSRLGGIVANERGAGRRIHREAVSSMRDRWSLHLTHARTVGCVRPAMAIQGDMGVQLLP